jgi:membrane-bound lytic murein transglycosylase D
LTLADVQELNPHVKRLTTPNDDPDFNLYVPQGLADKLVEEIAAIPEGMRVNWRKHRVEEGETLSQIAHRYRTTSLAIAQVNSLSEDARLQFGDKLIIPVTPGQGGRGPAGTNGSRIRYTVQRGDTVASIARDFDVTVAQIILADVPSASVAAAQPLKRTSPNGTAKVSGSEPIRVVHRVKKGDTLYAIATNYNTSINSIRDWNNLSEDGNIRIGERLTIYLQR